MTSKKIFWRVIKWTIVAIAILFIGVIVKLNQDVTPPKSEYVIGNLGARLFIRGEYRGLTSDKATWWITSNADHSQPDSSEDYVFVGLEPFLFRFEDDTLRIYTFPKVPVPKAFRSRIAVVQYEIDNPEFIRLSENRDSLGLTLAQ